MEPVDEEDIKAFLAESYESLNQVERDVIVLEKEPNNPEILVRIYRSIHTIKGNCGFLPFPKLEFIAHESEDLLNRLREGQLQLNLDIINVLLQLIDTIRQILTIIEMTGNESEADHLELIESLTQLSGASLPASLSPEVAFPPLGRGEKIKTVNESSIRVSVSLIDELMNLVGELVLTRNQILQFAANQEETGFSTTCQRLNLITNELRSGVMKTRMQPIHTLFSKFPRMTRDFAIACGKQVRVDMEGIQTELDKTVIEAIKDPLTHIVRNCIDHGIEMPAVRTAQGKPTTGRLLLRAFHQSGKVHIEISDDGSGIKVERLKQKAEQQGLITSAQAARMSEAEVLNLIFQPGLSTVEQVSQVSGRGVGMDIVKTNIEKINGTVEVHSRLGQGTTFSIKIPLTLAIIPALIVICGEERYALPQESLLELVHLEGEQACHGIEILYDVPVYRLRGNILPLVYLNRELYIQTQALPQAEDTINIVVLQAENQQFGLVVDFIDDTEEIVVKPLGKQLKEIATFAGATILGDGKVALIIDVIGLAQRTGVLSELRETLAAAQIGEVQEQLTESQMVLLFEGPGGQMAMPMALAQRLEEFPRSAVQTTVNQFVVQYRKQILSLIPLATIFSPHNQQTAEIPTTEDDMVQVIVVSFDQEHSVGLIVNRILDIVEEPLTIKGLATRPGVLFVTLLQNQLTEFLDVETIIRMSNPHLFQHLVGATTPSNPYG